MAKGLLASALRSAAPWWRSRELLWGATAGGLLWMVVLLQGANGKLTRGFDGNWLTYRPDLSGFLGLWLIAAGALSGGLTAWWGRRGSAGLPLPLASHLGLAFLGLVLGMGAGVFSGGAWHSLFGAYPGGSLLVPFTLGGLAGPAVAVRCGRWLGAGEAAAPRPGDRVRE